MATFIVDRAAMDYLLKDERGDVGRHLTKLGARLSRLAKRQAGVDTGALRKSINYRLAHRYGSLMVVVGSDNRIAFMHHQGTRPHIIMPRRAQTLRFYHRGRIVYSKLVHHPGTKPNRYLTDNLRRVI